MRFGIGGGNRLVRGGINVGRGGVRGGVGVGPVHIAGGGGRRRSRNRGGGSFAGGGGGGGGLTGTQIASGLFGVIALLAFVFVGTYVVTGLMGALLVLTSWQFQKGGRSRTTGLGGSIGNPRGIILGAAIGLVLAVWTFSAWDQFQNRSAYRLRTWFVRVDVAALALSALLLGIGVIRGRSAGPASAHTVASKRKWYVDAALVAGLQLVALAVLYGSFFRQVEPAKVMPDLGCMRLDEAESTLDKAGIKYSTYDRSAENRSIWITENWVVVDQRPSGGVKVVDGAALMVLKSEDPGAC